MRTQDKLLPINYNNLLLQSIIKHRKTLFIFNRRLSLVNPSTILLNTIYLQWIRGFMISSQVRYKFPFILGHNYPRVSNVDWISHIFNDEKACGTRTRSVQLLVRPRLSLDNKISLGLLTPIQNSLLWILRKISIIYDVEMQVISKVLRATDSPMAIKNAKEWTFRPLSEFIFWFDHIQDYWDSVLVIWSNYSFVSVCSVCCYQAWLLWRVFGIWSSREI